MNFANAKIGERYYVWVQRDTNFPSPSYHVNYDGSHKHKKLACTVVAIKADGDCVVGWKPSEEACAASYSLHDFQTAYTNPSELSEKIDNLEDFCRFRTFSCDRWAELIVGTVSVANCGGSACTVCKNFNEYAIPNQKDGTYKCYNCRV